MHPTVIGNESSEILNATTMIYIDSTSIPINGSNSIDIAINNVESLYIVALNITWNPSIVRVTVIDDTSSDFDFIYAQFNNNIGFARIDAYCFDDIVGLNGNVSICNLEFEPAITASIGDWCWINTTNSVLWDISLGIIPHTVSNNIISIVSNQIPSTAYGNDDFTSSTPGWQIDHFNIIQDGIDAVEENGTVFVYDGIYHEAIFINKTLDLIGEDKNKTIIFGTLGKSALSLNSNTNTIENFTIKHNESDSFYDSGILLKSDMNKINNCNFFNNSQGIFSLYQYEIYYQYNYISNCTFLHNDVGIHIPNSPNTTIIDCVIKDNYGSGINTSSNSDNTSIINCQIENNTYFGIFLAYANDFQIEKTVIRNNYEGIHLQKSKNSIISNSTISNSYTGIYSTLSSYNSIFNCTISSNSNNGVLLNSSNKNSLINTNISNNVGNGTKLYSSSNNIIVNNTLQSNGVGIRFSASANNNHIINCQIHNNMDDGINLKESIYNTIINNAIIGNADGMILSISSNNNNILNNNISNNGFGLVLYYANESNISGNNIHANSDDGISIFHSNFNTFYENTIMFNNASYNNNKGIDIHSSSNNNLFYHNNFVENNINAQDEGTNIWDNGYPSGGNYWDDYNGIDANSDGIGDIPYPINSMNQDNYPFMEPNGWSDFTIQDTVYVNDEYNTSTPGWQIDHFNIIQDGIDAVGDNGTVYVYNGTYEGGINVYKSLKIYGENKYNTIIDGLGNHNVVVGIANDYVHISGFTIQHSDNGLFTAGIYVGENHSKVNDNIVKDNGGTGIYCANYNENLEYILSVNNTIENNIINNNEELGIAVEYGKGNRINNNTLSSDGLILIQNYGNEVTNNSVNNKPLVYLNNSSNLNINNAGQVLIYNSNNITIKNTFIIDADWGLFIQSSNHITIDNNVFSNNYYGGFISDCNNLSISHNVISNNSDGVDCNGINRSIFENNYFFNNKNGLDIDESWQDVVSSNNIIKNNTFESNDYRGLELKGNYNQIYHNNFINNSNHAEGNGLNMWDNGYPSGGNYWDDYLGFDNFHGIYQDIPGSDAIGDTPYSILDSGNKDNYPFIHFNGWQLNLDINQSVFNRGFPIRHTPSGDWGAAQNFTFSCKYLSYVQIYLRKLGFPEFNLTVELRENHPQGTLLDTLTFTPDEVVSSWQWITLDFGDISVELDTNLFIVLPPAPSTITTSFGYEWGYAFGDQYQPGSFWFTRNSGALWRDLPSMYEFVFRTYGYS